MALEAGWHPPNAQELLEASIPDGSSWYEVRMPLKTISYTVDRFDSALQDAKALKRVFKAELFYCCKENGKLEAQRVW
jgi:hypothetical protein